jgi:DNA-binding NarL/FixJ family response regulator
VRVVIADDSGIFRHGLKLLLEAAGVEVAADVADVPHLLRAVQDHHPDAAILDVRMPPTHTDEGIRAAAELRHRHPATGVLVLSTYTDTGWAEQLLGDGHGGVGYLLKDRVDDVSGLLDALHRVAHGGTAVDNEIITALIGRRKQAGVLDNLTQREREVLAYMAQGLTNAGIGRAMFLATKTVEMHVAAIFTALNLPTDPTGSENRRVRAVIAFLSPE